MHLTQTKLRQRYSYNEEGALYHIRLMRVVHGAPGRYRTITIDRITYKLHRVIWFWHHGTLPTVIHHINHNTQDNRIENLTSVTASENNSLRRAYSNTGIKGVHHHRASGKYSATITRYFETAEEAQMQYERWNNA